MGIVILLLMPVLVITFVWLALHVILMVVKAWWLPYLLWGLALVVGWRYLIK
jgi:hypothetical protein